jgi:TrmH family RNA methyltransferase
MISLENYQIHEIKKIRTREYRKKSNLLIVEGYPEVSKALSAGVFFEKVYYCPEIPLSHQDDEELLKALRSQCESFFEISEADFAQIAFGARLKGILAICHVPKSLLSDISLPENPLVLVLESIEKPGNIGTIIRSCDAAGVDAVFVSESKTDVFNQHVVRSSIGSVFHVPVVEVNNDDILYYLKLNNIAIVYTSAKAKRCYTKTDLTKPLAIVIGNEHDGVSDFWKDNASEGINIPMNGVSSSLNAAMSATVVIYEAARQRGMET